MMELKWWSKILQQLNADATCAKNAAAVACLYTQFSSNTYDTHAWLIRDTCVIRMRFLVLCVNHAWIIRSSFAFIRECACCIRGMFAFPWKGVLFAYFIRISRVLYVSLLRDSNLKLLRITFNFSYIFHVCWRIRQGYSMLCINCTQFKRRALWHGL